jgi:chromosome segregation ATPase
MNNQTSETHSTQEQVSAICNRLYAEGIKPSVRLALSEMPGVSSTSTVHKYFKTWKEEIDANQQSLYDKLGFSSDFTKSFLKEITRFSVEAEQRYKSLAEDAAEQRDSAIGTLEQVEERFHKQQAVVEQKEKQIISLKDELTATKRDKEEQLAKAEEVHHATIAELREQLSKAAYENKTLSSLNEDIRTSQVKAELKLEGYQVSADELKAQNKAFVEDAKQLNMTLAEMREREKQTQAAINDIKMANKELEANTSKVREVYQATEGELRLQLESLRDENKSLNTNVSELNRLAAGLESTISGNEKLIEQLKGSVQQKPV